MQRWDTRIQIKLLEQQLKGKIDRLKRGLGALDYCFNGFPTSWNTRLSTRQHFYAF